MKKDKFNYKFREYARTLSPQENERNLIGKIYQSLKDLFGENNCMQIGSYPRYTAITPVKDLDILYFLGDWKENSHNPSTALDNLRSELINSYENPTDYEIKISLQTHSVTVRYLQGSTEIISIDIVPAYHFSKNEFNEDTYKVPEVITKKRGQKRAQYYQELAKEHKEMMWISSDPRGYIRVASDIDKSTNGEFRKTVKIIKRWKFNFEDKNENLKLKSFHLEQVITKFFQENQSLEIFDAIFNFFSELPEIIDNPNQISDRANSDKFIDDYLEEFTDEQKKQIVFARDGFLIKLENLKESSSIEELLEIVFYLRKPGEQFLFDFSKRTLIDDNFKFKIDGFVKPLEGFSAGWLTQSPQLQNGLTRGPGKKREIEFSIQINNTSATEYRWKVRNSDRCDRPRGEITLNQTKNNPESTEYIGDHYVECYAIVGDMCVASSRVNVKII